MNNEQEEIEYKDVIDLGFIPVPINDKIFFDRYGYPYTIVEIQFPGYLSFDWNMVTRKVRMIRTNDEGDILATVYIDDLKELKTLIEFFKAN